jgi:hypothetical protein
MATKIAAFDLEIARIMPADAGDLWQYSPLGITCAGIAYSDGRYEHFHDSPQLSVDGCSALVDHLINLQADGWTLVTWNGCGFDFRVLAEESGRKADCALLAMRHVDLMLHVTFRKGYFLGLEKALTGARLAGKQHGVTLPDGRVIDRIGPAAPALWAEGHQEIVLRYLRQDCEQTLALALDVARRKRIDWTAASGSPQSVAIPALASVEECYKLPEPDVSWMRTPPKRAEFMGWAR